MNKINEYVKWSNDTKKIYEASDLTEPFNILYWTFSSKSV